MTLVQDPDRVPSRAVVPGVTVNLFGRTIPGIFFTSSFLTVLTSDTPRVLQRLTTRTQLSGRTCFSGTRDCRGLSSTHENSKGKVCTLLTQCFSRLSNESKGVHQSPLVLDLRRARDRRRLSPFGAPGAGVVSISGSRRDDPVDCGARIRSPRGPGNG